MVEDLASSQAMIIGSIYTKAQKAEKKAGMGGAGAGAPTTLFLSKDMVFDLGAFDSLRGGGGKEEKGGGGGIMGILGKGKAKPKPTRILARIFNLKLKVGDPKGGDGEGGWEGGDLTGWGRFLEEGKKVMLLENNLLTLKRELHRLNLKIERGGEKEKDEGEKKKKKKGGIGSMCFSHPFLEGREIAAVDVNHACGFALSRGAMMKERGKKETEIDEKGSENTKESEKEKEMDVEIVEEKEKEEKEKEKEKEKKKKDKEKSPPPTPQRETALPLSHLLYGLNLCSSLHNPNKNTISTIEMDEFEKKIATEVINPDEIGVHFDDIGSHDSVKSVLYDMVILPLKRPELFGEGILAKPGRGVLLFGPPGTGLYFFCFVLFCFVLFCFVCLFIY